MNDDVKRAIAVTIIVMVIIATIGTQFFGWKLTSEPAPAKQSNCEALYQEFHRGEPHDAFIARCEDSNNFLSEGNK